MLSKNYSWKEKLRLKLATLNNQSSNFKGKIRLLRLLDNCLRTDSVSITRSVGSVNYQLDTRDILDFRLFYFGVTETNVLAYLSSEIGSNQTILWDIGASTGSVCLPLLTVCPNLNIYAFEPSPPIFTRLNVNVNLNPSLSKRIYLNNFALSNSSGMVNFFVSAEPHNSGVGSLEKMHNTAKNSIPVNCYKGDDLITKKSIPHPSFIKIDVEGFEYEVIDGLRGLLETDNNIQILFEHEPYRLKERRLEEDSVVKLLQDLNFKLHAISDSGKLTKFNNNMLAEHHDFVACKSSRS